MTSLNLKIYAYRLFKCSALFLLLLFCGIDVQAIDLRNDVFTTSNGLTDNSVRQIYQDSRGYVWFATFYGLSRYDGYDIVQYSPAQGNWPLEEIQVRNLVEDPYGYMWVLCNNDVVGCFDLKTEKFVDFLPKNSKGYRYITQLPGKALWLYGEHGALRVNYLEGGGFEVEELDTNHGLPSDNILRISTDPLGRELISTAKGLYAYDNGRLAEVDVTRAYQWLQPTENATLMVADNGDIVRIDHQGTLSQIGKIEGVCQRRQLPGAYLAENKWHVTSPGTTKTVDLATFKVEDEEKDKQVRSAKVIIDNTKETWLHNETGYLYYVDAETGTLTPLHLIPESTMRLIGTERYSIARDNQMRAWITTADNGLYIYDFSTHDLQQITAKDSLYKILPSDNLLYAMVDNQNNVWIATGQSGAVMLKTNNLKADFLRFPNIDDETVYVRMIKKLPDGRVVISTREGNLYTYSADLNQCDAEKRDAIVYDFAIDQDGNRIEATRERGLYINGQKCDSLKTSSNELFAVHIDSKGRLWVGTFGAGLDVFTRDRDGSMIRHNYLNGNYAERRVRAIFEDRQGNVWVATNAGVIRFDPDDLLTGKDNGTVFNMANGALTSNEIHCIEEDSQGRIWLGEAGNGITILDFSADQAHPRATHLGFDAGMTNNNVSAFVKDGDQFIWATTQHGVSRIDTSTLKVESFVFQTNPISNVHSTNSAVMLDDNRLLLGSNNGAYIVDLDKIKPRETFLGIEVTTFTVNGERHAFVPNSKNIKEKDGILSINLAHDENNLTFEFSTFDFEVPKITKFRYKLEPVDKAWGQVTADNTMQIKNLRPGKYRLIVEASFGSTEWNKRFECEINIQRPWWSTWWADIVYLILILFGGYMIFKVLKHIDQLHNKVKVEEQLTDYKLEFFTNISHEFRTPLTLIQVSLEKLHEKLMAIKEEYPSMHLQGLNAPLSTLDKNSRRMSRLIDELLTFRKVEKNKFVLYPEPTDVIAFIREGYENFKDEAVSKHLTYEFSTNRKTFEMNVDRNALDKIVNNLISNALKYTREGGKVMCSVSVEPERHMLRFQVIDNGVGIAPEKREQLFSRFMQSAMSRNSIGVGLHLTFGLVQLSKGSIYHSDNPGGGSIFTVELPTDTPASETKPQEGIGRPSFEAIFIETKDENPSETKTAEDEKKKKLLIIDDDADIRTFLSGEFSKYFEILTASDGRSGLEAARNNDVNLIICDVMMPDMSGFEVTRLLKEDFATSHIPIIQLTALSNDDCQIEGITSGADAYVTKPFNLKYLKTRVAKLIEQRENLFARFSATPTLARPQLPMGDKDKEFADKLAEVAQRQLDNSEFTVDDFAAEMALGRTIFFKKVKGVTGYAPKEYLRVIRMKKAAELLLTTDMTITEIAFSVGISDPAYFNKCFKAQFGKAPSVYQKENTQRPE